MALAVVEAGGGSNAGALITLRRLREDSPKHPHELTDVVPMRLHPLLSYVFEHSDERLDRGGVAAVFGLSRHTLQNRLTEARLPALRPFLTWCRLLVADITQLRARGAFREALQTFREAVQRSAYIEASLPRSSQAD